MTSQTGHIPVSEASLASYVDGLFARFGWTWAGFRPARVKTEDGESWRTPCLGDAKGFPDRFAIGPLLEGQDDRRVMLVELKGEAGKPTPEQKMWLDLAYEAGVETYLVRPSDRDEFAAIVLSKPAPYEVPGVKCAWINRREE